MEAAASEQEGSHPWRTAAPVAGRAANRTAKPDGGSHSGRDGKWKKPQSPSPPLLLLTAAPTLSVVDGAPASRAAKEICAFGVEGWQWIRPQAMAPKGAASVP